MMKSRSTGSGVIISNAGLVVTNHHVAGKAKRLNCRLHDGEELMADLIGADPMTDLAVLKLRLDEREQKKENLFVAKFGNSDEVEVGDICYAMGSPAGLSQSVTKGIISNLAMISPFQGSFRLDGENVGELVRWLGHDAIIFREAVVDHFSIKHGLIIGINEVGIGSLGGAIPSNLAKKIADELAKGLDSYHDRGQDWNANQFSTQASVVFWLLALLKILRTNGWFDPRDRIIKYNGKKVDAQIPEDLPVFNQFAYGIEPGRTVLIEGFRNQQKKTLETKNSTSRICFFERN